MEAVGYLRGEEEEERHFYFFPLFSQICFLFYLVYVAAIITTHVAH